jgi:hypothetical protein
MSSVAGSMMPGFVVRTVPAERIAAGKQKFHVK